MVESGRGGFSNTEVFQCSRNENLWVCTPGLNHGFWIWPDCVSPMLIVVLGALLKVVPVYYGVRNPLCVCVCVCACMCLFLSMYKGVRMYMLPHFQTLCVQMQEVIHYQINGHGEIAHTTNSKLSHIVYIHACTV